MMQKWTYVIPILFLSGGIVGCDEQKSKETSSLSAHAPTSNNMLIANAEISNPSSFSRPGQTVYFSYYDLGLNTDSVHFIQAQKQASSDNDSSAVKLATEVVDQDLDGTPDGVLVAVPLASAETVDVHLYKVDVAPDNIKRTQAEISHKVEGEWVTHSKYPESDKKEYSGGYFVNVEELTLPPQYTDHSYWVRYEGPGIESDKVGYRIYADWRNGFDIFGKLGAEPILKKVGVDGYQSYHEMQPWGMDILKVGQSLGAGGFGLWHQDELQLLSDVEQHSVTILENGALQSSFSIDYKGWQSHIGKQDLNASFTMRSGSSSVLAQLNFASHVDQIAVGLVKHKDTELLIGDLDITGKAYSYIASWGNQALDGSPLGMAVFFRKQDLAKQVTDDSNYMAILSPNGSPTKDNDQRQYLHYYFDAAWAPQSGIATKQEYLEYLDQQAEILTIQPRIRLNTQATLSLSATELTAEKALAVSQLLADSELNRKGFIYNYNGWDVNRKRPPKFEYDIVGLYPHALYQLSLATNNAKYKEGIKQITASFIEENGQIKRYDFNSFNIDAVAPGPAVLDLYKETGESRFKLAADLLRKQLAEQPRTSEGAFWHKQKYPYQLWLDGVYMGMPFMTEYEVMFADGEHLKEVIKEFELTERYLKDPDTGLYFHAWDEQKQQSWANPETGLSEEIWARGVGWFAMSLVDVLAIIPTENTVLRTPLLRITQNLATVLIEHQDPETGTWWQVMDKPQQTGNYRESSASAMFTYFLAKAVNNGYIPAEYKAHAKQAFQGLLDEFVLVHDNGDISMTNQCYVAGLGFGRDGSYHYYMTEPVWQNDPKGTGPFILAGIAVSEMLRNNNND